jgi:asparagine synthase (glutamine-hydrolysing)
MCGFAGYLSLGRTRDAEDVLHRMAATLVHRGPDDAGYWSDPDAGIGLGFRRLAIIDLSPAGHQPMVSASGRYVLVFNGEIYNYRTLRADLERESAAGAGAPLAWRGGSDTEVLLTAIEAWGLDTTLTRCNGMFALALWDRRSRTLHLARDRFGEKPLYYGWMGATFLFGSELKALRAHPAWCGTVDRAALALYLRYSYVPAPYSIYQGIHKLQPGHLCSLSLPCDPGQTPPPRAYWSVKAIAEAGQRQPFTGTAQEAITELDTLLREAVALRMVADVPLGAFLSGGVDSSLIVALMQAQSSIPVQTFTIGFDATGYDEAPYARAVAAHLGTEHCELYVTSQQLLDVVPRLPSLYDAPFADATQIPAVLVAWMTRQHVTVALSGEGGDELFGGYNRYFWLQSICARFGWLPSRARQWLSRLMLALPPAVWNRVYALATPLLPHGMRVNLPGDSLHKLARVLACQSPEAMYLGLVSHWEPAALLAGVTEPSTAPTDPSRWAALPDFTQRLMYLDQITYLPGDGLAKTDRATMAASLEARAPLLDPRVAELAWRLPMDMKIRAHQGKWALRQVLQRYIPAALIERPKMGFAVPVDGWLRGPLRDWAEHLLDPRRLGEEGYFDPAPIRQKWHEHDTGRANWAYPLWTILMFQTWLENERSSPAPPAKATSPLNIG